MVDPIPKETLEAMADRIAKEHGVEPETLANLVWSESRWNPLADNGVDRGLVQINRKAWPEITDEMAFDPEFSLNFASKKIVDGEEHIFVVCNCYALATVKYGKLPRMKDVLPNTDLDVGVVAIFDYNGVKHLAYVESVNEDSFTVFEANYKPCLLGHREVNKNDPSLVGFYK